MWPSVPSCYLCGLCGCFCPLAFFRCHREERLSFLLHVPAPAVRAPYFLVIVLIQGQDFFKFLVAVVAEIVVHGHGEPPAEFVGNAKRIVVLSRRQGSDVEKQKSKPQRHLVMTSFVVSFLLPAWYEQSPQNPNHEGHEDCTKA